MMIAITLSLWVALVSICSAGSTRYTDKYDNVDLDQLLKNNRLFDKYFKCLMGEGICTPDGAELKSVLPDALTTECSKCSPKQKAGAEKVIRFLIKNKAKAWQKLEEKYDPTGAYRKKIPASFLAD